jgi:hypothetical protein
MVAEKIEQIIKNKVNEILQKSEVPEIVELIQTDNIGEVIEKLVILHIRMWMLEDKISLSLDKDEIVDLKRKIDICFKNKRPKFVQAINLMIDNAVKTGNPLTEESVKYYKGENSG